MNPEKIYVIIGIIHRYSLGTITINYTPPQPPILSPEKKTAYQTCNAIFCLIKK